MDRIDRQETAETVFDGITCQMLLYNDIDGVFRLEVDPETGEASYDTEGYTTLREHFSGGMSKKAAVQVLKSLMSVWVGLDEYMIPRNELLMGLSDVYVKDDTGEIRWLCGLQKDARNPLEKLRLFMMELTTVMHGDPEQNRENMRALLNYIRGVKRENLDECKAMADALLLQDITADAATAAAAEEPEAYGLGDADTVTEPEAGEPAFREEPEAAEEPEGVDIMIPDAFKGPGEVAYIIQIRTGNEMAIMLDETLLGKSPDCDFCIPDNRAVSRHHASIIMDEGEYYIVDHNSTNATYLNGIKLDPGDEYRLCHGDGFVLADEPFQFMIR